MGYPLVALLNAAVWKVQGQETSPAWTEEDTELLQRLADAVGDMDVGDLLGLLRATRFFDAEAPLPPHVPDAPEWREPRGR